MYPMSNNYGRFNYQSHWFTKLKIFYDSVENTSRVIATIPEIFINNIKVVDDPDDVPTTVSPYDYYVVNDPVELDILNKLNVYMLYTSDTRSGSRMRSRMCRANYNVYVAVKPNIVLY